MFRHTVLAAVATASLAGPLAGPPATAAGPAQGLTCGLRAGALHGGPVVFTGEIATLVTYRCTLRVVSASGVGEQSRSFDSPGPVGLLPPAPVAFAADPARDRVEVCTQVDWVFGFPGGGTVDAGCREATFGSLGGWELTPEVMS